MKILTVGLAGLLLSATAFAQHSEMSDAQIADAYLHAYATVDAAAMGEYLADDAIFSDRGSFGGPNEPYHYEGRDAIIAAITLFHERWGLYSINYDNPIMHHEAGGQSIYVVNAEARWRMADGQDRVWRGDIVTTVRVMDGEVTEHLDMPDYAGGVMSVEAPLAD
jgi:ketosteroid isomerase-like protein